MACIPGRGGTSAHFVDVNVPSARSVFSRVGAIDSASLLYGGEENVVNASGSRTLDILRNIDAFDKQKLYEESKSDN